MSSRSARHGNRSHAFQCFDGLPVVVTLISEIARAASAACDASHTRRCISRCSSSVVGLGGRDFCESRPLSLARANARPIAARKAADRSWCGCRWSIRAPPKDRSAARPRSPSSWRHAVRVVSGTMPMPTLHSTNRHTASKLRNCTRSRNGLPIAHRFAGEEALQRAGAIESDEVVVEHVFKTDLRSFRQRMVAARRRARSGRGETDKFRARARRPFQRRCRGRRRLRRSSRRSRRSSALPDRR